MSNLRTLSRTASLIPKILCALFCAFVVAALALPFSRSRAQEKSGAPPVNQLATNGRIVYAENVLDSANIMHGFIFTVNPDGSGKSKVGEGIYPAWSYDGTKIAFGCVNDLFKNNANDNNQGICVMNADGSNILPIPNTKGFSGPSWSPDGKKLAASGPDSSNHSVIFTFNLDGSNLNLIANGQGDFLLNWPVWSPDGTKIAYDSWNTNISVHAIHTVNIDGSGDHQLSPDQFRFVGYAMPDWSPDGKKIAVTKISSDNSKSAIVTLDAKTGAETLISPSDVNSPSAQRDYWPSWSPDGTQIAYSQFVKTNTGTEVPTINVMNADGSNRHQIIGGGNNDGNRWGGVRDVLPPPPPPTDGRPANDDLTKAIQLVGQSGQVTGSNVDATFETPLKYPAPIGSDRTEPLHAGHMGGKSVWYFWVPTTTGTGTAEVDVSSNDFDTLLAVYSFDLTNNGQVQREFVSNDDISATNTNSAVVFQYDDHHSYFIVVDGKVSERGGIGNFTLNWRSFPTVMPSPPVAQTIDIGIFPSIQCTTNSTATDICQNLGTSGLMGGKNSIESEIGEGGYRVISVRGHNLTPDSQVLIEGTAVQNMKGTDDQGNPVSGQLAFFGVTPDHPYTELIAQIPPNPPFNEAGLGSLRVITPVSSGTAAKTAALSSDNECGNPFCLQVPDNTYAIANLSRAVNIIEAQSATIPAGQKGIRVCEDLANSNAAGEQTCLTFDNPGTQDVVVKPTYFSFYAECLSMRPEQGVICLSNHFKNDSDFAINAASLFVTGKIKVEKQVTLSPTEAQLIKSGAIRVAVGVEGGKTTAGIVAQGGGNVVSHDGGTLIGQDGSGVVSHDGGTVVSHDGGTLLSPNGSNALPKLISHDGGSLIGQDGSTLRVQGGQIVAQGGGNIRTGTNQSQQASASADGLSSGIGGMIIASSSGGNQPTFDYTIDPVTGEAHGTVTFTLDDTSFPRASDVSGMAFAVMVNPAIIQVTAQNVTVDAGAATAAVSLTRTGDMNVPVYVEYLTVDDTAKAGTDYTTTSGNVTFAPGETEKIINVPLSGKPFNAQRKFNLVIGNVAGGALQTPNYTTVTIPATSCSFTLSSTSQSFGASAGAGTVGVTAILSDCNWQATSNAQWITISSGGSGTGNGTVSYAVAENTSTSARTGTVTIGGQTFTITQAGAPPNSVQLSAATYTVGEGAGNVAVVVNRTDTTSAATVDYATSDTAGLTACNQLTGVASSRCDYAITIGTLRFAAGESSKTIFIPIVDDAYVDGTETFTLRLSNPSGATLGTNSEASITITDNDTSASNPIVGVPFFVRQQYIDFLGREPDAAGFQGWQNILNNCAAGDASCDRIAVSSGFFRSPEFQDRGYFIFRFYSADLGRNPFYSEFMPDLAKVSGFLSDAQLEANKLAFVQEFMTRPEFVNKYGSLNNTAFVDTLIQTSGLSSHPLRGAWIDVLNNGTATRAQVLRAFTESLEVYNKFYNQAFVVMQYFGYLRRDPDAAYTQWIQTLNQSGDFRSMISGFMNSNEYVLRFGP